MLSRLKSWLRLTAVLIVGVGGIGLVLRPHWATLWVLPALATAMWPLERARRGARGTALGSAVAWAFAAVIVGMVAQFVGLRETWESGRPGAGHLAYLSTLAALAAMTSILNARRPGAGAWALLMGVLVLVFLVPWLEGRGLVRSPDGWERLRLAPPWTIFFAVLVLTGMTNYLPTRFGPAALGMGVSFGLAYLGLTGTDWLPAWRGWTWSAASWALAAAIWTAEFLSARARAEKPGIERLWRWFRDHWGVVWALRVQERFNRTAESAGWPIRLSWHGVVPAPNVESTDPMEIPAAAEPTLKLLLRRFADESRLDSEAAG